MTPAGRALAIGAAMREAWRSTPAWRRNEGNDRDLVRELEERLADRGLRIVEAEKPAP